MASSTTSTLDPFNYVRVLFQGSSKHEGTQRPLPRHGVDFPHSMVSPDHLKDVFIRNTALAEQRKIADALMQASADPIIRGDHHHKLAKHVL
jgi:hypothetical protein